MTQSFSPCQQSVVRLDTQFLEVVLASPRTSNPFLSRFIDFLQAALRRLDVPQSPEAAPQSPGQAPPSQNYVPGPEHPPSPDYVLGPEYPKYVAP
ncbi:hypothetical protein Tco_1263219 [Tanacetum coccineum]